MSNGQTNPNPFQAHLLLPSPVHSSNKGDPKLQRRGKEGTGKVKKINIRNWKLEARTRFDRAGNQISSEPSKRDDMEEEVCSKERVAVADLNQPQTSC